MKIAAIIPARYGSQRFPGKPLALIAGKPMIQRVYEQASQSSKLDAVYVATDDQRIEACVKGFGGQVIMTSPDHGSGTDRIFEAAAILGLGSEDLVVNIQGDQPVFPPSLVEGLVVPFEQDSLLAMSTLARPLSSYEQALNPNQVKVVIDRDGFALYFSRSPIPYHRDGGGETSTYLKHIGVYAYKVWFLEIFSRLPQSTLEKAERLEQLRALENGYKIKVVITSLDSPEVDVPEDIGRVERALG